MVKDLLSDDRNKGAKDDASVLSRFVSGRVAMLYLETMEAVEADTKKIWGEVRSFVGSCAELSEARVPSTSLGCGPCLLLCGPTWLLVSGYYGGIRHQNRGRVRRGKTRTMGEGYILKTHTCA